MLKFNPFQYKSKKEKHFFKSLFFKYSDNDIEVVLNNLLASVDILSINQQHLVSINEEFNINIQRDYRELLISFYLKYYEYSIRELETDFQQKSKRVSHLKELFSLSNNELVQKLESIQEIQMRMKLKNYVYDDVFDDSEQKEWIRLANRIGLPVANLRAIYSDIANRRVGQKYAEISNDGKLSPSEVEEFDIICSGLNVTIDERQQLKIRQLERNWEISIGNIPTVTSDIYLTRGELLYLSLIHISEPTRPY